MVRCTRGDRTARSISLCICDGDNATGTPPGTACMASSKPLRIDCEYTDSGISLGKADMVHCTRDCPDTCGRRTGVVSTAVCTPGVSCPSDNPSKLPHIDGHTPAYVRIDSYTSPKPVMATVVYQDTAPPRYDHIAASESSTSSYRRTSRDISPGTGDHTEASPCIFVCNRTALHRGPCTGVHTLRSSPGTA